MSKIEHDGNVTKLIAGSKYFPHIRGEALISVENTGNGYHITQHRFSCIEQDNIYSIDYNLANDLRKVLNYLHKKNRGLLNG